MNGVWKKAAILAVGALLVGLFVYFDLSRFLTLDYIKESQARFQILYANQSVLVLGVFLLVYILVAALSLPGAGVLTLAAGALFGFVTGLIVVSIASTIGATLACMVSRFILRDWVQTRFGGRITTINDGIDKDGAFYLFTLRLIPVFPFFVINLLMGLTRMPIITYFWVSQLGMLPGTIVYVNAGKEIAKIDSLGGILSPTLIISFVILGLFPITVKKIMGVVEKKRNKR